MPVHAGARRGRRAGLVRFRRAQGSQVERGVPALRPTVGPRRRHHMLHRPHRGRGRRGHGDLPSERRVHGGGVPECSTVATRPRVLPRRVPQRQRGDGPQLRDIAHAIPARGPRPADRRRRRGAGVAQIRRGVRATLRLRRRRRPGSVERDLPLRDVGEYVPAERDARASDAGRRGDARVRHAAGGGSLGGDRRGRRGVRAAAPDPRPATRVDTNGHSWGGAKARRRVRAHDAFAARRFVRRPLPARYFSSGSTVWGRVRLRKLFQLGVRPVRRRADPRARRGGPLDPVPRGSRVYSGDVVDRAGGERKDVRFAVAFAAGVCRGDRSR